MTKTAKQAQLDALYQALVDQSEGQVEGGYLKPAPFAAWLKKALKVATGRAWSVRGSRGTAYGWLNVSAPKDREEGPYGYTSEEDRVLLREAFQTERIHHQGYMIPSSRGFYWQAAQAVTGRPITIHGVRDWD